MRGILILFFVVAFTGCGSYLSRVYRPHNFIAGVGYRDKQISEGVWEVTYHTDHTDNANYASRYARYRAAELARQAGFPFFHIVRVQEWARTVPQSRIVTLTVRGARSRDEKVQCEVTPPLPCRSHSTDAALRDFEPVERPRPPSGEQPPNAPR